MWLKRLYRWWIEKGPPSMRDNPICPAGRFAIRRCAIDGLTYNGNVAFKKCDQCGQETEVMCVLPDTLENGEPPTYAESMALRHEISQQKMREAMYQGATRARQRAAEEAANERIVNAAVASLNFDLEGWLEYDPADWRPAKELGG